MPTNPGDAAVAHLLAFSARRGFTKRFGLVWTDHASGRRIRKASYAYYRDVIAQARQER